MFTREDTKAVKGIAVILMLFHHLAGFTSRLPVDFAFVSIWKGFVEDGYLKSFALGANICVSIFFFLGGYGLYKRYEEGRFSLSKSIISLYKQYWKVFFIFVPIAFIFFARTGEDINALCTRYVIKDTKDFISAVLGNFTAYSDSFNKEWWFLASYLCILPLGYLFCQATKKCKNFVQCMFIVIIIDIFIRSVFPALPNITVLNSLGSNAFYSRFFKITDFASVFFAGIIFARYDMLVKLKKRISSITFKNIACIVGFAVIIWCRSFIAGKELDIIYTPFFIAFVSILIDNVKGIKKGFTVLGKHSLNIWLIHTFYCYYFLEATKVVYITKIVWIDLLILLEMSLLTSILLELLYQYLGKVWSQIKGRIAKKNVEIPKEVL